LLRARVVKNRVPLFGLRVDSGVRRVLCPTIEIRGSETPQFAYAQTSNEPGARVTLEDFGMHFYEGRCLHAVEQGFEDMNGIEHRSYTPIHHNASDREARLHYLDVLVKALLETRGASRRWKNLKAISGTIGAEDFLI
jgi:hypothetical protein